MNKTKKIDNALMMVYEPLPDPTFRLFEIERKNLNTPSNFSNGHIRQPSMCIWYVPGTLHP
jgi:hypothetical protein